MPLSQSRFLSFASLAFGCFPTFVGVQILLDPLTGFSLLGYDVPTDPSSRALSASLMRLFGVRDMTIGLITLTVWRSGDRKTLATTIAFGTLLAVMDGFVNRINVQGGEWKHWVFVPMGAFISGGIFGLFDRVL